MIRSLLILIATTVASMASAQENAPTMCDSFFTDAGLVLESLDDQFRVGEITRTNIAEEHIELIMHAQKLALGLCPNLEDLFVWTSSEAPGLCVIFQDAVADLYQSHQTMLDIRATTSTESARLNMRVIRLTHSLATGMCPEFEPLFTGEGRVVFQLEEDDLG